MNSHNISIKKQGISPVLFNTIQTENLNRRQGKPPAVDVLS